MDQETLFIHARLRNPYKKEYMSIIYYTKIGLEKREKSKSSRQKMTNSIS